MTITLNDIVRTAHENRFKETDKPFDSFVAITHALDKLQYHMKGSEPDRILEHLGNIYLKCEPSRLPGRDMTGLNPYRLFAANGDVRIYLDYIYVDENGKIFASDGHTLLTSKQDSGLEAGFYDPNTLLKLYEKDWARYPDCSKVLSQSKVKVDFNIEETKDIGGDKNRYEICQVGTGWFNSGYIDRIKRVFKGKDFECYCSDENVPFLLLESDEHIGVVMGVRV